jgi:preprotein translocase SecF subunit
MTGGIQIEYAVSDKNMTSAIEKAKTLANAIGEKTLINDKKTVNGISVYGITGTDAFIVEAGFEKGAELTEVAIQDAKASFTKELTTGLTQESNNAISQSRYINIGESFGAYIKKSGYITLTLAIIMIAFYIAYAFRGSIPGMASWPFAAVTGVSLIHDILVAFGLYVATSYFFPEFKIDTFFFTALLTILGYSINDTIVVMDRIRSNLGEAGGKKVGLSQVIDTSIRDTMSRSLLTSSTVFIVLLALFFFGPETLKGFTLVLLFGTVVGTYSSVCIASPLLIDITKK